MKVNGVPLNPYYGRFLLVACSGTGVLASLVFFKALSPAVISAVGLLLIVVLTLMPLPGPLGLFTLLGLVLGRPLAWTAATRDSLRMAGLPSRFRVIVALELVVLVAAWIAVVYFLYGLAPRGS